VTNAGEGVAYPGAGVSQACGRLPVLTFSHLAGAGVLEAARRRGLLEGSSPLLLLYYSSSFFLLYYSPA